MSIQNASIEDFDEENIEENELKDNLEGEEDESGAILDLDPDGEFDSDVDKDEDEEYGAKVRKRIGKEVSKRKVIEHERDGFKDERDIYKTEADTARQELADFRKKQFDDDRKRLTEEIESDKKIASAALEDGESDKYSQYNERMTDNKILLSRNEQAAEMHEIQESRQPQRTDDSGMNGVATNWMNENKDWIKSDPAKFKRAQRLSNQLESEGYDVNDMDLYEEMDKRLNQSQTRHNEEVHVPGGNPPSKKPKVDELTNQDKRNMEDYGLNKNNAEDRKNWLAGKRGVL